MSEQETARGVESEPAVKAGEGGDAACPAVAASDRAALIAGLLPCSAVDRWGWRGASGTLYDHAVTSLIGAQPTGPSCYVLVRRAASGDLRVLAIGTVESETPTLNLAHLRREGATLGANEVHLWAAGAGTRERILVAEDIAAAVAPDMPLAVAAAALGDEAMSLDLCA